MKRQSQKAAPEWTSLRVPHVGAPKPLIVREQTLTARQHFPEHSHDWYQLVYATSGSLTVNAERQSFVISPDHAVWLPSGVGHRVGSLLGAEFRSLYIAKRANLKAPKAIAVFKVSDLLRALIIEAAAVQRKRPDQYAQSVNGLIFSQLERAEQIVFSLPWPKDQDILPLCDALYADPANKRGVEEWASELGMSMRTLERHFETDVGMPLRLWRRKLKLFKAIELLGGGERITDIAFDLGYASTSSFIHMFKLEIGISPRAYQRGDR